MKFLSKILLFVMLLGAIPAQAAWVWQSTGTVAQGFADDGIDVTVASGISAGNDLFIWAAPRTATGVTGVCDTPSGWTQVAIQDADAGSAGGQLFWKKAAGGETTIELTGCASVNYMAVMLRYTGGPAAGLVAHAVAKQYDSGVQDIVTPALTISQPNTLVLFLGARSWNFTPTVSSWPASATNRVAAASSLGSSELSLFVGEVVQTTATSISAGSIDLSDTNVAAYSSMVVSIEPTSTIPTFTTGPTWGSPSITGGTISETPDAAGTVYWICRASSSSPASAAQVQAGQDSTGAAALLSGSEAITGADSQVVGTMTFPEYDCDVILRYSSTNSAVYTLSNVTKLPPSGKQYSRLTSVSGTSFCNDISSPAVAISDTVQIDTETDPGSFALTIDAACDLSYTGTTARQSVEYDIYDYSAGDFMAGGPGTIWFNNQAPFATQPTLVFDLIVGDALSVDICSTFTDFEADTLTFSNSNTGTGTGVDKRPAGTSFGSTQNCTWSGTPTTVGAGSFTITATDTPGSTGDLIVEWSVADVATVPNCVSTAHTVVECATELAGANLEFSVSSMAYSSTVASGNIFSQSPAAGASVAPYSTVNLVVSRGPADITPSSGGYSLIVSPTEDTTFYAVAVPRHAAEPSAAQIEAGTDGDDVAAVAVDSVTVLADATGVLELTGLTLPKYDMYIVGKINGVYDVVTSVLDQLKAPPYGRQYIEVEL